MAITIKKIPCPDTTLQVNGVTEGTHVAGSTIGINLSDGVNPVTPDSVTKVGDNYEVVVQVGGASSGAILNKTGQTTSFRAGDDGDIQSGKLLSFDTLASNNIFGNTNRFTDELGGQVYANDIVIDHSQDDQVSELVLGYKITEYAVTSWNQAVDDCAGTSIGSFTTGWHLTNVVELENISCWDLTSQLNHTLAGLTSPFGVGGTWEAWTSNTYASSSASAMTRTHLGTRLNRAKTGTAASKAWACRYFTYAELGL